MLAIGVQDCPRNLPVLDTAADSMPGRLFNTRTSRVNQRIAASGASMLRLHVLCAIRHDAHNLSEQPAVFAGVIPVPSFSTFGWGDE